MFKKIKNFPRYQSIHEVFFFSAEYRVSARECLIIHVKNSVGGRLPNWGPRKLHTARRLIAHSTGSFCLNHPLC